MPARRNTPARVTVPGTTLAHEATEFRFVPCYQRANFMDIHREPGLAGASAARGLARGGASRALQQETSLTRLRSVMRAEPIRPPIQTG